MAQQFSINDKELNDFCENTKRRIRLYIELRAQEARGRLLTSYLRNVTKIMVEPPKYNGPKIFSRAWIDELALYKDPTT